MLRIIFIILLFCFSSAYAEKDVYIIKNIKISADNKVASLARTEAIEAGQLKAFRGLVKLHYPEALNKLNKIPKDDIYSLVESYELSNEKRSATHYSAKLKIKFSRKHVDRLMNNLGIYFTEAKVSTTEFNEEMVENKIENSPSESSSLTFITLLIPVYKNNDKEYWLDEHNNSWYNFLLSKKFNSNFVLPISDLEDLILINHKMLSKNLIDLSPLLEKYNANNIAIYYIEDIKDEASHIASFKTYYLNKFHYAWQSYNFPSQTNDDLNKIFENNYVYLQNFNFNKNTQIQAENYKETDPYLIQIEYPVEKISDWTYLQKMLAEINYISNIKLIKITKNKYTFSIVSKISIENLKQALELRGYALEPSNKQYNLTKIDSHEQN